MDLEAIGPVVCAIHNWLFFCWLLHLEKEDTVLQLDMHLHIAITLHLLVRFDPHKGYRSSGDAKEKTIRGF